MEHLGSALAEFVNPIYDYISDVQWSPSNPSVFVSFSAGGWLFLWNIAKSATEPVETFRIEASTRTNIAINKALWFEDSEQLLLGDSKGYIHSLKFHSGLLTTPADEVKFHNLVSTQSSPLNPTPIEKNVGDRSITKEQFL